MFNAVDVLMVFVMAVFAFLGFRTGIIASLSYFLSGFAGIIAAKTFGRDSALAYYLIFLATAGAIVLLGLLLRQVFRKVFLGTMDRVWGTVLGVLLGVLIGTSGLLVSMPRVAVRARRAISDSCYGTYVLPRIRGLFPWIESLGRDQFRKLLPGEVQAAAEPDYFKMVTERPK